MITPAEWLQARIDKVCTSIEETLRAPDIDFPITAYLAGDNARDVEVAQGVVQNLVINGWTAKLEGFPAAGPGFTGSLAVQVNLPAGLLHVHDTPAAAAGWDALRERCAWFENLYARFVDAPKVGADITGMRFGKVDRYLNEIDDLRAELKDTRGDLETAFVTLEEIQGAVRALAAQGNAFESKRLQQILSDIGPGLARLDDLADFILSEFGRHDVDQVAHSAPDASTAVDEATRLLTLAKERGAFARDPLRFGEWDNPQAGVRSLLTRLESAHKELEDLDAIGDYMVNFEKRTVDDEAARVMTAGKGLAGVVTGLLDLAIKRGAFPNEDDFESDDDFEAISSQLASGGGGERDLGEVFGAGLGELFRLIGLAKSPGQIESTQNLGTLIEAAARQRAARA